MGEWDVVVSDVVEEVDLFLLQEETGGDRMDRGVAPSFVEEAAVFVEVGKEINVCLGSKPVEVSNFEIGPLLRVSTISSINTGEHSQSGSGCRSLHHRHSRNPGSFLRQHARGVSS